MRSRWRGSPDVRSTFDRVVSVLRSHRHALVGMQSERLLQRRPRLRQASLLPRRLSPVFQQASALGTTRRGELERPSEAGLGAGHVDGQGPLPREGEIAARGCLQLRDVLLLADGASQLQRLDVVIGEHVAEVVGALSGVRLDPGGSGAMPGGLLERGIWA